MKKWIILVNLFLIGFIAKAQYSVYDGPDRYFYNDDFDWRWDVRVRISDGMNSGYLTSREANRLYRQLEDIERKEWAFQADGYYSVWEQDEIWEDVVNLNHWIGLELTDWDRRYYGYTGVVIRGYLPCYFGTSYDFYRFDKRGYGSVRLGYIPRNYHPVKHVYYNHRNNYTSNWNKRPARTVSPARVNSNARVSSSDRYSSSRDVSARSTNGRYNDSRNSRTIETPSRASSSRTRENYSSSRKSSTGAINRSSETVRRSSSESARPSNPAVRERSSSTSSKEVNRSTRTRSGSSSDVSRSSRTISERTTSSERKSNSTENGRSSSSRRGN